MTRTRKRCAIVGVGHRAHSWLDGIVNRHPATAELAALCDPYVERCRDANAAYGVAAAVYTDYDRLLAEAKPDLVIVTSPERFHREHIVKALDAGCAVATEKPLCLTMEDARAILEAERRAGRPIFMAFNYRHIPLCSKIRELIRNGAIGRPVSMDLTWYLDYKGHGASYFRRWHRRMRESGGLLITKACHHFDLANWWMDDVPETVFAFGARRFFGAGHNPYQGERCSTCSHAAQCQWYTDVCVTNRTEELSRELGYRVKGVRGYIRDYCPFGDDVDIYDTMAVCVRYRNGGLLSYSLNASVPFEGWNLAINGTKGRLESKITDAKPAASWVPKDWRRDYQGQTVEWPGEYRVFVMPHDAEACELTVPNIAEGHGGGDFRMMAALLGGGTESLADPLGVFASARDGALSIAIGDAANRAAASAQVVQLGDW